MLFRRQRFCNRVYLVWWFLLIARIFPRPFGARKNTTQLAKYPRVLYVKPLNKICLLHDWLRERARWIKSCDWLRVGDSVLARDVRCPFSCIPSLVHEHCKLFLVKMVWYLTCSFLLVLMELNWLSWSTITQEENKRKSKDRPVWVISGHPDRTIIPHIWIGRSPFPPLPV